MSIKLPEFQLKTKNEDFQVTEVYLSPKIKSTKTDQKYSHTYLEIQKEGMTTFELLDRLANFFEIPAENTQASGLKDEEAITTQIISVKKMVTPQTQTKFNTTFSDSLPKSSILKIIGYGNEPVQPRYLHGNKFLITIRNLSDQELNNLKVFLKSNRFFSFINYYDEQRFGIPGSIHNTHIIGKNLLKQDLESAYNELLKSGNYEGSIASGVYKTTQSYSKALDVIQSRKKSFYISSWNSHLWNKSLSNLIENNNSVSYAFEYLPLLHFPEMRTAELPVLHQIETHEFDFTKNIAIKKIKSRPTYITTAVYLRKSMIDNINKGKYACTLEFYLPTGCYATMCIKQLFLQANKD